MVSRWPVVLLTLAACRPSGNGDSSTTSSSSGTMTSSMGPSSNQVSSAGTSSGTLSSGVSGSMASSSSLPASSSGGASSGGGPTASVAGFLDEVARLTCSYEERCSATRGRAYANEAECLVAQERRQQVCRVYTAGGLTCTQREALGRTLSPVTELQACLDQLTNLPCNSPVEATALSCLVRLNPRPTDALVNEACGFSAAGPKSCAPGLYCSGDGRLACSACLALKADGQACTDPGACQGQLCLNQQCATRSALLLGQACDPTCANDTCACASGLQCATAGAGFACLPKAAPGQACTAGCQYPAECQGTAGNRTCVSLLATGSPCPLEGTRFEDFCATFFCRPNPQSTTMGTCVDIPQVGEGAPCFNNGSCQAGFHPVRDANGCTCTANTVAGGPCFTGIECVDRCLFDAPGGPVCGTVYSVPLGQLCGVRGCALDDCLPDAQAQLRCTAHQCPSPTVCTQAATNVDQATAAPLAFDTLLDAQFCVAGLQELWFSLPATQDGDAIRLAVVTPPEAAQHNVLLTTPGGSLFPWLSSETTFIPGAAAQNFVHFSFGSTAQVLGIRLSAHLFPAATLNCPNPPTNVSNATALPLSLNQVANARVCSAPNRTFHYRINGPFNAGTRLQFQSTASTAGRLPMRLVLQELGASDAVLQEHEDYPRDSRQVLTLSNAAAALMIVVDDSPQVVDYQFNLKLSLAP